MQSPQDLLNTLQTSLAEWAIFGRRAQLNAVLPVLAILVQRKAGYAGLAKLLTDNGLDISPAAIRQAVHRWRKKQGDAPIADVPSLPAPAAPIGRSSSAAGSAQMGTVSQGEPSSLPPARGLTKADIQALRDQHIDLGAIVKSAKRLDGKP